MQGEVAWEVGNAASLKQRAMEGGQMERPKCMRVGLEEANVGNVQRNIG